MRWKTFEVEPEWPLECVCCGELVPDEDCDICDWLYVLDAYDTPAEEYEAFQNAFEITDALADFHICRACLNRHGWFGEDGDPMDWLNGFLQEDAKLMSRQRGTAPAWKLMYRHGCWPCAEKNDKLA